MKTVELAIGSVLVVIGATISLNAYLSQAPSVAQLTSTGTGTALANAGITSNTLAGTVYSFTNVFWALAPLVLIAGLVFVGYQKAKGR